MTTTTSTAQQLRDAATRLRTAGTNATPGPWTIGNGTTIGLGITQTERGCFTYETQLATVIDDEEREEENNPARHPLGSAEDDATWIALASPVIAEPLAAWLEETARTARQHQTAGGYAGMPTFRWCIDCDTEECDGLLNLDRALAVARAINGTPAVTG